jgi:integrase/recombinase XerD
MFGVKFSSSTAWIAQQERQRIRERTLAGLAKARKEGRVGGRPRIVTDRSRIKDLRAAGQSLRQISSVLGLSMSTTARISKRRTDHVRNFQYPAVAARHRSGPFAEARERFVKHCASQGLARATLQHYAQELLVVAERIDIASGEVIGSSAIDVAADRWAREQHQHHRTHGLRWSRELFIQTARSWLHFLGRLEVSKTMVVPFADRLADFDAYRRDERGLSPVTIRNQDWHVEKFLGWLGEQNRSFDNVSLDDVDAFLAANGKRGWNRVSVATSAKALRAFFKHAAIRGWCSASIAVGIDGPRLFQHEGLPVGPPWPDVQRLIGSTGGDSARDIRDRAILILLATYGLRSSEVAGLRLEDVNWESEIVSIARPKQRRAQEYPLVSEAGEAILQYLQRARPRCARREIFLTVKAPFRRLSPGALYHLVSTRLGIL